MPRESAAGGAGGHAFVRSGERSTGGEAGKGVERPEAGGFRPPLPAGPVGVPWRRLTGGDNDDNVYQLSHE